MITKSKLFIFAFLLMLSSLKSNADVGVNFLNFGAGARSMGMGRCGVGLANDASAPYYNPAGLCQLKPQEILFMHSALFMGTSFDYFSYVLPTSRSGSFAFSLMQVRTGGIENRDESNTLLDKFGEAETSGMLSYSINLIDFLSLGINYKILYHSISHWSSIGQSFDIGFLLFPERAFSAGFTVNNLLKPSFTLISESEEYPLCFKAGISCKTFDDNLIFASDITWQENCKLQLNGGLEYKINSLLRLRLGADYNYFSYGVGFSFPVSKHNLRIDYAFQQHHQSQGILSPNQNLSLTFNFGGFRAKLYPDKKVFFPMSDGENNIVWLYKEIMTKDEIEKWKLSIKNSWGEIIRTYEGWRELPTRLYWDGRDNNGKLVRYGDYFYKFIVTEKNGRTYTSDGKLSTVKTSGPKERFIIEEEWEGLEKDIYTGEEIKFEETLKSKKETKSDKKNKNSENKEEK
jgi:hypothetical protein